MIYTMVVLMVEGEVFDQESSLMRLVKEKDQANAWLLDYRETEGTKSLLKPVLGLIAMSN